jgi:hypothetical protein
MDAATLHIAVSAVAPIVGVSVDIPGDPATWRVHFDDAATQAERDAAAAVLAQLAADQIAEPAAT